MNNITLYRFNLDKLVNNFNGSKKHINKTIKSFHKMNKSLVKNDFEIFYKSNYDLMIKLAEENISTVTDLNDYENWMENVEQ